MGAKNALLSSENQLFIFPSRVKSVRELHIIKKFLLNKAFENFPILFGISSIKIPWKIMEFFLQN